MGLRIALYQPDIPQNAGAIMRTAACFGVGVDVIEPCGFVWDERRMRRAGMDYLDRADIRRHASWSDFRDAPYRESMAGGGRLVLLTTRGDTRLHDFRFADGDCLVVGRESAGVPDDVHRAADSRIVIPVAAGMRSLNVAQAAAISLAEALRQLDALPRGA